MSVNDPRGTKHCIRAPEETTGSCFYAAIFFFFGSAAVVTEAAAWQFELVQLMVPKVSCLSSGFKSSCWYKTE